MGKRTSVGDKRPLTLPPVLAYIVGAPVAPREAVEQLIERAIEVLDHMDGDPDAEDATDLEDDFSLSEQALGYGDGAGCPISDPGGDFANEDDFGGHRQSPIPPGPGCENSDPAMYDPKAYAEHKRRIQASRCVQHIRRYRDWQSGEIVQEVDCHELVHPPTVPTKRQMLTRKRGVPRRPQG